MDYMREILDISAEEAEETWLNTKQVRKMLGVCDGTLNLWAKRGYLVPAKVGGKNMYAKTDVLRIQTGGRYQSVAAYCRRQKRGTWQED